MDLVEGGADLAREGLALLLLAGEALDVGGLVAPLALGGPEAERHRELLAQRDVRVEGRRSRGACCCAEAGGRAAAGGR